MLPADLATAKRTAIPTKDKPRAAVVPGWRHGSRRARGWARTLGPWGSVVPVAVLAGTAWVSRSRPTLLLSRYGDSRKCRCPSVS